MTSATDNRTTELLPCPFCGGEATVERIGKSGYYYVACNTAYCCDFGNFDTEAESIAAWNTRKGSKMAVANVTVQFDDEKMAELRDEAHELIDGRIAELEQLVRDMRTVIAVHEGDDDYESGRHFDKRMAELGIGVYE